MQEMISFCSSVWILHNFVLLCKLRRISNQMFCTLIEIILPMTSKVTSDFFNSFSLFYFFLFLLVSYNIVSICNLNSTTKKIIHSWFAKKKQQQNNTKIKIDDKRRGQCTTILVFFIYILGIFLLLLLMFWGVVLLYIISI